MRLLRGAGLGAVIGIGLPDFEGEFLAFETGADERAGTVIMLLDHGSAVFCRGFEIHQLRRQLGDDLLALHDTDFHAGTAAIPLQLVVTGFERGSVHGDGIRQAQAGFCSGKCTRGQQQSQPQNQTLRNCRELHDCSFFFPEVTSGSGWGGPARDQREKTLVFPHESPRMLAPGLSTQAASLCCRDGGFLTWAAKPSVRESPNPAKLKLRVEPGQSYSTGHVSPAAQYACTAPEVPHTTASVTFPWTRYARFR